MASPRISLAVAPERALPSAFVVYREPFSSSLPKAAALGYDGVELALMDRSQVDMTELKRLLAATGLGVPMVSTGQVFAEAGDSFASADPAVRARAETRFAGLMEVAAEFGAYINVGRVRGQVAPNGTRAEVESRAADSLARLARRGADLGVKILIEPVNRYEIDFLNSCADTMDFLERHGLANLGIMPDVFHMNIEDPSIEGSLMRWADRIGYVHFADSNRYSPGAGHLDFASIVASLRAVGYAGWIGTEILPLPDPDTAARAAIRHLRRFI